MTVPSADHGEFATGDVVTVSQGVEKVHENVLFSGDEPGNLAGFLDAALSTPRGDRTASLFDDEMTLKIEGDGHGRWSVECRPVPLPPPDAMWDTFPAFSFELSAAAMQRAVAELQALSASLARRRADLKP